MEGARPKSSLQCQFSNCQRILPSLEDLERHEVGVHGVVSTRNYPMNTPIQKVVVVDDQQRQRLENFLQLKKKLGEPKVGDEVSFFTKGI